VHTTATSAIGAPSATAPSHLEHASIATPGDGRVRGEVGAFAAVAAALSIGSTAGAAALGADLAHLEDASPVAQTLLFAAAFIPAVSAVAARVLTGQPVRGAGWGLGRPGVRGSIRRAWLAPLLYVGAAAAGVWLLGLGGFSPGELSAELGEGAPDHLGAAVVALAAVTVGAVPFAALALGEELAWRGSIATRLSTLTTPFRAAAVIGLLWSVFHWPLLLLVPGAVEGAPTALAVACFTVSIAASAFPMHRLWQRTRSVWPAVVFHAVHNAAIYFVTDPLTADRGSTEWFAGETGLALAITTAAVSWWLWHRWAPEPSS
jgi:uncharacterized protein